MDREVAQRLVEDVVKCHKALDIADETARSCSDEAEQLRIRRALAEASGLLTAEIIMEIIRVYPELDPYPRPD
jgi:hypothetical protein